MSTSQICKFYAGQNVFITGGTGFMGKLLIEKLLRSTSVANVYVLIRQKKEKNVGERLNEMLRNEVFEKLRNQYPDYKNRVTAVGGDVAKPHLGLSSMDREKLISNVNIVFHLAATVRFFDDIKYSYNMNVEGTRSVLTLSKQLKNLKSLVHVSTAFVHSKLNFLDEVLYDSEEHTKIEDKVNVMSENEVAKVTQSILQSWPTTYAVTKTIAELLVKRSAKDLPVGVYRPCIVISTYKEPLKGWIDSLSGAALFSVGVSKGLIHVSPVSTSLVAEFVPGDMATAALIASAWNVNKRFSETADNIPVYNYVSSVDNPLTYQEGWELTKMQYMNDYPWSAFVRFPKLILTDNLKVYWFFNILLHYVPAAVVDLFRVICFKKPRVISQCRNVDRLSSILKYINDLKRTYKNDNVKKMWSEMNNEDKALFQFDFTTFQWLLYFRNYVKGLKQYLVK